MYLIVLVLAGVGTAGVLAIVGGGDEPPGVKTCADGTEVLVDEECPVEDPPDTDLR